MLTMYYNECLALSSAVGLQSFRSCSTGPKEATADPSLKYVSGDEKRDLIAQKNDPRLELEIQTWATFWKI